jgi:hypothetical protein
MNRVPILALTIVLSTALACAQNLSGKYERILNGKPDTNSATITIEEKGNGKVHVEGDAVWVGNAATGHVNNGEIKGDSAVANNLILYRDPSTGCRMTIAIVKDGLKVSKTTSACGGLNVTFNGTYRKAVK